jgi:hypothetical protein
MKPLRVWAVARKEFIHVIRDPRSLGMGIAIPMLLLLLFGYPRSPGRSITLKGRLPSVRRPSTRNQWDPPNWRRDNRCPRKTAGRRSS